MEEVRTRAAGLLKALDEAGSALDRSGAPRTSWVDGTAYDPRVADARKAAFDRDGFLVVRGFVDASTVARMREEMGALAEAWQPGDAIVSFRTDAGQESAQARSDYFLDSADRVHFFAEPDALDAATGTLRVPKALALNKAGHGLHVDQDSVFGEYARSEALAELVHALGWRDPVLPQSMCALLCARPSLLPLPRSLSGAFLASSYRPSFPRAQPLFAQLHFTRAAPLAHVHERTHRPPFLVRFPPPWPRACARRARTCRYIFKQPRHGGEVTSHQDSSFLHTEPRQTCLGLWLALDDATLENGCLWVRPASHAEPLRRRFERNPRYFGDEAEGISADPSAPQMVFTPLEPPPGQSHGPGAKWEGALPEGAWPLPSAGLFGAGFVPVEVRAGDLVCFPGLLDHLSLPNRSECARHTFQLHLVEGPRAGVRWSASNWLQYPPGKEFPRVPAPHAAGGPQTHTDQITYS